jgi:amino acid adenylation domain-containing protein
MYGNMTEGGFAAEAGSDRAADAGIHSTLATLLTRLLPMDAQPRDGQRTFLEMGANSLTFMEISLAIEKTFGIHIPIGRFFQDLSSPEALQRFIAADAGAGTIPAQEAQPPMAGPRMDSDLLSGKPAAADVAAQMPSWVASTPDAEAGEIAAVPPSTPEPPRTLPATELEGILAQQLQAISQAMEQVVSQQLDFLRTAGSGSKASPPPQPSAPPTVPTPVKPVVEEPAQADTRETHQARPVTPRQQQFLDAFIEKYNDRTRESKRLAQSQQRVLADIRSIMGFSPEIKELFYPIFATRSDGACLQDVDGNDYLDIAMGAGVYLFGHNPSFIAEAIQEQLSNGIQLGPQSPLAGEVAQMICELTGMQRVAFCCSGTEAVMTALRLARAARGRHKIVMFTGSYHGHADGTLVIPRAIAGSHSSVPLVAGVPEAVARDVIVLDYDAPRSLEVIADRADELGAVLVEPVQSRRPDLQPRAFLQALRRLTRERSIPLIFDEMITGFRLHPGGAQAWFGVQADLATYGKVIGGGLPLGIVAGKAEFLDWIDGGAWNDRDGTLPSDRTTYAAGTFRKHPLAMAAARVVLHRLKREGDALQGRLNQQTEELANSLNAFFSGEDLPLKMVHCGSLFRFVMADNYSYMYQPLAMDLFYYHLLASGIYLWEGRTCFLTTAHTENDRARLVDAVMRSCETLQEHGFLPQSRRSDGRSVAAVAEQAVDDAPGGKVPLKDDQRHLRLLQQIDEEGSLAYQNFLSYRLRGDLDVALVRRCVQRVFDRHDALRTLICRDEDAQEVKPAMPVEIPLEDLSDLPPSAREERLAAWFNRESRSPLDIYRGPLARVSLVKMAGDEHILTLTAHHIVIDGWSMSLIITEICQLYIASKEGKPLVLEPPYQFSEYLRRYAERMQTEEMAAHEAYWLAQFQDSIPVLHLPTDYPTPNLRKFRGGRRIGRIDRQLVNEMQQIATDHACTLFITLMSVYFILLHRLTGQPEIVVGVPSGGRSFEGGGRLVGYCTSMMAIRHQMMAGQSFSDYLDGFKQVALEALNHQEYPFARLNDKLLMQKGSKHSSIVSVTFNMEPVLPQPELPGIEAELLSHPIGYTGVDLLLNCTEDDGDLILDLDYNSGLFAPETVDRLLDQYQTLLEAIATDPGLKVGDLPLLNAAERHRLLLEWNSTDRVFTPPACLHQLFEQQAAARPEATALVCSGSEPLTYRQLNARANRLAHFLQGQGVGPETLVGLCLERVTDLVVGLLGILKAGAAYLPLDPTYPAERQAFMLGDAQVGIVITQSHLTEQLGTASARLCCVDEMAAALEAMPGTAPPGQVTPENSAYVIYTSGSTGQPKGVSITHANVVRLFQATQAWFHFDEQDVWTLFHSHAFDFSVWELWGALLHGGRLVIVPYWISRSPDDFHALLINEGVTVLNQTPSAFRQLIRADARSAAAGELSLRLVIFGGEALDYSNLRPWFERHGDHKPQLVNMYGITETTVHVTYHPITADDLEQTGSPIGVPIPDLQTYVLDQNLQPMPVGVTGEIVIGGAGLARGYLNRPALTAARFLPDPFSNRPGARLYRSGDLGCYQTDGSIKYLGRLDHQVKIRGFRIELGEIVAVLSRHPLVRESVAVVQTTAMGDQRLVLYVVPRGEADNHLLSESLRAYLKERLPAHMVPGAVVAISELPLTENGKIDREALPAPAEEVSEAHFEPPRTPIEEILAAIFVDVLEVERVGLFDDFFELGGHSLLAAMVVTRVRETFDIRFEARRMFESPTVAGLAAYIQAELKAKQVPARPPIRHIEHDGLLPLSFAQQRMWFIDRLWADITTYNLLYGMRVKGSLDVDALQRSLAEIVRRHAVLRTIYPVAEGTVRQRILTELQLELQLVDLRDRPATEQVAETRDWLQHEAQLPFDLSRQGPVRARMLRIGPENHVVLLTFHHIAFDGWSEGVLNRELAILYDNFTKGQPSSLAPLPVQYADFAVWQHSSLTDEVLNQQIDYWQEAMRDAPGLLPLPFDRQPPTHKTFRGAAEEFRIDASLAHGLRRLGRQAGTTLYTTLLGAYTSLLSGYSGQTTMAINTPVVNRQPLELEPLIGFFVSSMLIRADLSDDPTFLELLARLHKKALAGYGLDDVPFDRLLGDAAQPTDLERTPLFHLMFNLVNAPIGQLAVGGLTITPLEVEGMTPRPSFTLYDLALSLRDTREGLYGELRYNTDLFDAATVKRMLADFTRLLLLVAKNPSQRLEELVACLSAQSSQ